MTKISLPARRKMGFVLTVPIALVALQLGRWYRDTYVPVVEPMAKIPDAAKVGNVEDSIQRMKRLIKALEKVNGDPMKVSEADQYLPDVKYHEDQGFVRDNGSPISYMHFPGVPSDPEYNDVVMMTDLYVRSNSKVFKGDRVTHKPTGFFLIGWKNGDVTKVPVEDMRWMRRANGKGSILSCPGMPNYDKDEGQPLAIVRFANGGTEKEKREYFAKKSAGSPDKDCQGCAK